MNGDRLGELFGSSSSDNSDWDVDQGTIDVLSLAKHGKEVIDILDKQRRMPLVKISDAGCGDEICEWNRVRDNLDILLADAVLSQFNPKSANMPDGLGKALYEFKYEEGTNSLDIKGTLTDSRNSSNIYNYDEYFMASSSLLEDAVWFVKGVESCVGALNLTGMVAQRCIDWYDGVTNLSWTDVCQSVFGIFESVKDFATDVLTCPAFLVNYKNLLDKHESKLIAISESMARISLLAWLKKADGFRNYSLLKYKSTYDGVLAWLELAGPFLDYNNIVIKAYGSLALFEYLHYGTDENLKMVNSTLNRHYGDNGGFSEGTGYSQYIWDDLTYVLAALKDAFKMQKEPEKFSINEKFLKSPDYMFEFSRPVGLVDENGVLKHYGLIPVEIDDGVTYNPDFRVWAKLKDEPKYLAMSEKYPLKEENGKINALVAFGFPDASLYNSGEKKIPERGLLWGDFKDGIGLITVVKKDDDTVSLSMIAESGDLWTRGQSHDQQDNLSITLASSKKGFLIQDPGYSGFGTRSSQDHFHRYTSHNVLTDGYGQDDNQEIPFDEVWSRTRDFTETFIGPSLSSDIGIWKIFFNAGYNLSVEGGQSASVFDQKINEPENGLIGYTAKTRIGTTGDRKDYVKRTIMYFGETFWVIDRPETDYPDAISLYWCINSPINNWNKIGIHLYRAKKYSEMNSSDVTKSDNRRIPQNGARADFDKDGNLIDYFYRAWGDKDNTFVMTYPVGEDSFVQDRGECTYGYQCFVNTSKNMKVVVPPQGEKFKLCDMLPRNECSGDAYSTGITMLVKTSSDEWTTRWVLDGNLYAVEKGREYQINSATVSRTGYNYENSDGSHVNGYHTANHLPSIPLLLLR